LLDLVEADLVEALQWAHGILESAVSAALISINAACGASQMFLTTSIVTLR